MISDFLHALHTGSDAAIGTGSLPSGPLGDIAEAFLRFPSDVTAAAEFFFYGLGS